MTDEQELDIFATAAYRIVKDYFDITLYRPTGQMVIFVANPRLRKRGWKRALKNRLMAINASAKIKRENESYVIIIERSSRKIAPPPLLNVLLFLLTFLSVLLAASFWQYGEKIFANPELILSGLPFTLTLLVILLVHEMGHFWAGYSRGIVMSYPFFIPAPTYLGTFGALIRSRTPIKNRNDLILVGASGPLAGVVPAIIALFVGYAQSTIVTAYGGNMITFGDSLLSAFIKLTVLGTVPAGKTVLLSQIARAGKVGLLVTMINLLPLGQLDGGHILYGLIGKWQHKLSIVILAGLAACGFFWQGWWIWLILAVIMKPFHPAVINDGQPPDKRHRIMGWISMILFVVTFVPAPITIG